MQAMQSVNLTDHFLIAMPAMADPYFSRTLVYIAEHNEQGALGVIVNRPIDMSLATLFEKIDVPLEAEGFANLPVFFWRARTNRSRLRSAPANWRLAIDAGGQ